MYSQKVSGLAYRLNLTDTNITYINGLSITRKKKKKKKWHQNSYPGAYLSVRNTRKSYSTFLLGFLHGQSGIQMSQRPEVLPQLILDCICLVGKSARFVNELNSAQIAASLGSWISTGHSWLIRLLIIYTGKRFHAFASVFHCYWRDVQLVLPFPSAIATLHIGTTFQNGTPRAPFCYSFSMREGLVLLDGNPVTSTFNNHAGKLFHLDVTCFWMWQGPD